LSDPFIAATAAAPVIVFSPTAAAMAVKLVGVTVVLPELAGSGNA
jgi:hypothetical protein